MRQQAVALGGAAVSAEPSRQLRRNIEAEHVAAPARALDVEVEGRAGRPLGVLGDDLVPGAVAPVVGRLGDAVLLCGVRDEGDRAARLDTSFEEGAC